MFQNVFNIAKESDSNPYAWTCGTDSNIFHHRPVGSGGYAEVHEVIAPLTPFRGFRIENF